MPDPTDYDVHPDMFALIAAKQAVPRTLDPEAMRESWNAYGARTGQDYPPGMQVHDTHAETPGAGRDGTVPIRIYRPTAALDPSPCAIYLHGGAFVKGSLDSGDSVAWGIAEHTGAVVVSVDYRLAPDHPYPAAVEDCAPSQPAHASHVGAVQPIVTPWSRILPPGVANTASTQIALH